MHIPPPSKHTNARTHARTHTHTHAQGSQHRRVTEVLLGEIGRRASNDRLVDREGHSLAAGLALGLVTLGHGDRAQAITLYSTTCRIM